MTPAATATRLELVPEGNYHESGSGKAFEVATAPGGSYLVELEILRVIDQESLDVSFWGSADGKDWGTMPLLKLPQRFYPGETRAVLDLRERPEVKFIQPRWEMNRWGRGRPVPVFRFKVSAQPVS